MRARVDRVLAEGARARRAPLQPCSSTSGRVLLVIVRGALREKGARCGGNCALSGTPSSARPPLTLSSHRCASDGLPPPPGAHSRAPVRDFQLELPRRAPDERAHAAQRRAQRGKRAAGHRRGLGGVRARGAAQVLIYRLPSVTVAWPSTLCVCARARPASARAGATPRVSSSVQRGRPGGVGWGVGGRCACLSRHTRRAACWRLLPCCERASAGALPRGMHRRAAVARPRGL